MPCDCDTQVLPATLEVDDALGAGEFGDQHAAFDFACLGLDRQGRDMVRADAEDVSAVGQVFGRTPGGPRLVTEDRQLVAALFDVGDVDRRIGEDLGRDEVAWARDRWLMSVRTG